ncbi:MAG TPA: hypothetical protein DEA08_30960 [Planctomycetes bacterium]|nr:hypothetical protein [Planctomycetota bacterium]
MEPLRVVLVEQNPEVGALLRAGLGTGMVHPLGDAAPEVVQVGTLGEALEELGARPDLVLVGDDPGVEQLEAIRRLTRAAPAIPVLVWTTRDERQRALEAVRLGARDWLVRAELPPKALWRVICYAVEHQRAWRRQGELLQRLQATQRLETMGALAGAVVHDLNNLLSVVSANASLVRLEVEDARLHARLEQIQAAAQRAGELTRQLLDYARDVPPAPQPVHLSDVTGEVVGLLEAFLRPLAIEVELRPDLPAIEADSGRLQQVVLNLVTNAVEAAGAEGRVRVSTGVIELSPEQLGTCRVRPEGEEPAGGEHVYVLVEDDGPGLAPEALNKIFDPFFTTKGGARGLGLAAVEWIVRSQGGALCVDSSPGQGAKFRVAFPARPGLSVSSPSVATDTDRWRAAAEVLVVEEDAAVLETFRALLTRLGCLAHLTRGVDDALEVLGRRRKIQAIYLAGRQLAGAAPLLEAGLPVVVCSNDAEDGARSLPKPFTYQELKRSLKDVLG